MSDFVKAHQEKQEAKYRIPYHYLETQDTINGITYLSYLRRACGLLEERHAMHVLDAGCGDGRFVAFVRDALPQVSIEGLDYSDAALVFARFYNPGVTFTSADVAKAPYQPASFDAITLIEVVEHIPVSELPAMLRSCGALLKSDGVLVITTPTTQEKKMSKAHFQHFTKESMEKNLMEAGLKLLHIEGQHKASMWQKLFHGVMQNRFFEIRSKKMLALYRSCFSRFWNRCPVEHGRRMIVVAGR